MTNIATKSTSSNIQNMKECTYCNHGSRIQPRRSVNKVKSDQDGFRSKSLYGQRKCLLQVGSIHPVPEMPTKFSNSRKNSCQTRKQAKEISTIYRITTLYRELENTTTGGCTVDTSIFAASKKLDNQKRGASNFLT